MPCAADTVCRFGYCIAPPAACASDGECADDSYCHASECLPYGVGPRPDSNPQCTRLAVIGLFAPKVQCEWTGPPAGDPWPSHRNVLVTPLVADFRFAGTPIVGELGSVHPSVVFTTYNCLDGAAGQEPGCYGVIRVIDGKTCQQQHSFAGTEQAIIGSATPAIADLDLDGRPEIVATRIGGGILGFRFDPAANGGAGGFVDAWAASTALNAFNGHWDSLSIHDLDDDGVPEILQYGPDPAVYRSNGTVLSSVSAAVSSHFIHAVAADVDGDGTVELFNGREKIRFNPTTKTLVPVAPGVTLSPGQVALADFGRYGPNAAQDDRALLDGKPEVVVVSGGQVRVQTSDDTPRVIFGPLAIPGGGTGGAPTASDFDGDGRVEFGVAGGSAYSVFDLDCLAGQAPSSTCPTPAATVATAGVLWSALSQDQSSNVSGSSVFDFEGDGRTEVVYADECFSRVYDGQSGDVLYSEHHTSCTWYENPVVADVDGDLRSEIVVGSNANCNVSCPTYDPIHGGLRCESDADCPVSTACRKEAAADKYGRCRCSANADCGSPNLVCLDPPAGPSAQGKVCRAYHPTGAPVQGVKVLHDASDRWVGSRVIWNQHAYAVTHVGEDGKVPRTSQWKQNWLDPKLNNFRTNVQGELAATAVPDLTSRGGTDFTCDGQNATLTARICNRGTAPVASGVPVTFYRGTRAVQNKACTATTTKFLAVAGCEVVSCVWSNAPTEATDVVVVADDDGSGAGTSTECDEENNLGTLRGVSCATIN